MNNGVRIVSMKSRAINCPFDKLLLDAMSRHILGRHLLRLEKLVFLSNWVEWPGRKRNEMV